MVTKSDIRPQLAEVTERMRSLAILSGLIVIAFFVFVAFPGFPS